MFTHLNSYCLQQEMSFQFQVSVRRTGRQLPAAVTKATMNCSGLRGPARMLSSAYPAASINSRNAVNRSALTVCGRVASSLINSTICSNLTNSMGSRKLTHEALMRCEKKIVFFVFYYYLKLTILSVYVVRLLAIWFVLYFILFFYLCIVLFS